MQKSFLIITFEKQQILAGTAPAIFLTPSLLDTHAGRQLWVIQGYDSDPREIYEIPEIRAYFHGLHARHPGWLAWLDLKQLSNFLILSCALSVFPHCTPHESGNKTAWLDRGALNEFLSIDLRACCQRIHAGGRIAPVVADAVSIIKALGIEIPEVTMGGIAGR